MLNETILLLKETLEKTPTPVVTDGNTTSTINPGDSTALLDNQRKMMETALEKMVQMQSTLFTKTVEELSKTVQEVQSQLKPVGVVRQAMSSLKASTQKKAEKPEKTEKQEKEVIAEKEELPLLKEVVKEEEKPTKPLNKKSYESDTINEDEYEILTEFDIQED